MSYVSRASKVFLNTGTRFPRRIIWALGMVKYVAAKVNVELGLLDRRRGRAIMEVSTKLARGDFDDRITVDVFQTGSGTGLNMNVNEIIAEESTKLLGISVHPNDHVNIGQSSNDVVPTAMRIAALAEVLWNLKPALKHFVKSLEATMNSTINCVKPGRTHLRDALPVTLGQEIGAYVDAFRHHLTRLEMAIKFVGQIPLGGTAVGTGLNTHPEFPKRAVKELSRVTGLPLMEAKSRFRAMRLLTDLVMLSGVFKGISLDLWRLGNDIRLMYSGPNTGIGEIDIPQEVPGSSMMPGKVNPVTVEAAMQAAAQIIGLDYANTIANLLGEFELSMGIPIIGYNVVTQAKILAEALRKMDTMVITKIIPNKEKMRKMAEMSQALITVLSPIIGYEKTSEISKMMGGGEPLRDILKKLGYNKEEINRLLDFSRLTKEGIPAHELKQRD